MKPHFFDIWQRQFEIYMVKCKILNTSERDQFLHCMNKLNTFIRTTMVIAYGKAKGEQMERGKLPENEPWNIHKLKKVWLVCINKLKHSLAFLVYKFFYLRIAKVKKGKCLEQKWNMFKILWMEKFWFFPYYILLMTDSGYF